MRGNELAHLRIDLLPPAAAAEDAVVTGALAGEVFAVAFGHARAYLLRGPGLAFAGHVAAPAFHRPQPPPPARRRLPAPPRPLPPAPPPPPLPAPPAPVPPPPPPP